MTVVPYISLFLYCIIMATAYALVFKKKFSESLAPAFFIHILLILFVAMMFHHVSWGIYSGVLLASAVILIKSLQLIKKRIPHSSDDVKNTLNNIYNDTGFIIFLIFYIFIIAISNIGKTLRSDEIFFWGRFVKETLRIDDLYCCSAYSVAHKDYLPAITLFEVLWCKLSWRVSESDMFRAIQMIQFSMFLPAVCKNKDSEIHSLQNKKMLGLDFLKTLFVLICFFYFHDFSFYHSIYKDMVLGITAFYCVYTVYTDYDDEKYRTFILTLSLSVLLLIKMTAIIFLPMVVLYYAVSSVKYNRAKENWRTYALLILLTVAVPLCLWFLVNKYIAHYVSVSGSQSYKSHSLAELAAAITRTGLPLWKMQIKDIYLKGLLHETLFMHFSYVFIVTIVAVTLGIIAFLEKNSVRRSKILLADLWVVLAGISYAFFYYYLYSTAFDQEEVSHLAGYSRYMNSYTIVMLLLGFAIFSSKPDKFKSIMILAVDAAFVILIPLVHIERIKELSPAFITHEEMRHKNAQEIADKINAKTPESLDTSVFVIAKNMKERPTDQEYNFCGGEYLNVLDEVIAFYTIPRTIVCPVPFADCDIASFINTVSRYEYIYLADPDEDFISRYGEVFADKTAIKAGNLLKVNVKDGKIYSEEL